MRFLPPSQRFGHSRGSSCENGRTAPLAAAALLGEEHPLVSVLARMETVGQQLCVVSVVHVAGLLQWWLQREMGKPVAIAALAWGAVLACRLFLLAQARRQECVTLIAEAREGLALEPVVRERRRLSSRRNRTRLARAVEELAQPRPFGANPLTARPPIEARVVGPARPWLHEISASLCREDASVRGVARLELLMCSPMSALYGGDPERLRREVGRVRYLLWS